MVFAWWIYVLVLQQAAANQMCNQDSLDPNCTAETRNMLVKKQQRRTIKTESVSEGWNDDLLNRWMDNKHNKWTLCYTEKNYSRKLSSCSCIDTTCYEVSGSAVWKNCIYTECKVKGLWWDADHG